MPRTAGGPAGMLLAPGPTRLRARAEAGSLAIVHENLDAKIYARLRDLIVERQFRPGERILVDHLAAEMGVSRTPVLNALRRLGQEGVVECFSRRGIFVRRYSKTEMVRLFAVREVLEGLATRLAAARMAPEEVHRFAEAFRRHGAAGGAAAIRKYVELDRTFHCRLIEIADNDPLSAAMRSVNMRLFVWQDGLVRPPAATMPEHLAILDALRRRDPNAGEAAMRTHIRRSLEQLERDAAAEAGAGQPGKEVEQKGRRQPAGHRG